jgi:hypothetical protein
LEAIVSESRIYYQRQLTDLHKNLATLETGIGYTLLQQGRDTAENTRYTKLETQKQDAADRIALIQELVATQKDVARQINELDSAQKKYGFDLDKAYTDLGRVLGDDWPEEIGDSFANDLGATLALKAKIQPNSVFTDEGEDHDSAAGQARTSKAQSLGHLFAHLRDNTAASLASLSRGQVQYRLDKAHTKLGRAVFESQKLDEVAAAGSLSTDLLRACDRCKEVSSTLSDLAERRASLREQQDNTGVALKKEGANGTGKVRIDELKKQIRISSIAEDSLALQVGKAFADTVFDSEGVQLRSPADAAKEGAAGKADSNSDLHGELVSQLTDDGRVRTHITACNMDLAMLDLEKELAALTKKMLNGNKLITDNKQTIAKLTAEIADTETMLTTSNDLCQKLTAERAELAQKRSTLLR